MERHTCYSLFYSWEHTVLFRIYTRSENAPKADPVYKVTSRDSPDSATDPSRTLFHAAVFMDYRMVTEVNYH